MDNTSGSDLVDHRVISPLDIGYSWEVSRSVKGILTKFEEDLDSKSG